MHVIKTAIFFYGMCVVVNVSVCVCFWVLNQHTSKGFYGVM